MNYLVNKYSGQLLIDFIKHKYPSYIINEGENNKIELNIIGIRNSNGTINKFDDALYIIYKYENLWINKSYKMTTDPGLYWLQHPMNVNGTAILKENQYVDSWMLGKHKGEDALVQRKKVTVIRDRNQDNKIDINGKEYTGFFGIDIHNASNYHESTIIDKWSAGCQVVPNPDDFEDFLSLCRLHERNFGNKFTYTLLNSNEIDMYRLSNIQPKGLDNIS